MRFTTKILTAGAVLMLASAPVAPRAHAAPVPVASLSVVRTSNAASVVVASVVQDAKIDVNLNNKHGAWYTNPVWIAIGIIALVLIIALIAMAGRGRDTTVIK